VGGGRHRRSIRSEDVAELERSSNGDVTFEIDLGSIPLGHFSKRSIREGSEDQILIRCVRDADEH
jgi:hypothetical protein